MRDYACCEKCGCRLAGECGPGPCCNCGHGASVPSSWVRWDDGRVVVEPPRDRTHA